MIITLNSLEVSNSFISFNHTAFAPSKAMKVENDEKFNSIDVSASDDFPIAYVFPKIYSQRDDFNSTIPTTTTVITEKEFFNLHGYIFETDLKIEATRLQDQHCSARVEPQVQVQSHGNGRNIEILCPKNILVKVKRLSNRTMAAMLCPKKVVLKVKKLSAEMLEKYATKLSCQISLVEKVFICDICNKILRSKKTIKNHMKLHSTCYDQRLFRCPVCTKIFRSVIRFRQHQLQHISTKCKFSCQLCSKSYSHEGALKQHLQEHLGENTANVKMWRCQFCQMKFFTSQELAVHRGTHTDVSLYQCEFCPMNFYSQAAFYHHKRLHENDVCIDKPFECYLCKKKVALLHYLLNHMRIHTKKYDCRICTRIYNQEEDLDNHMLTHSGKYRFECSQCSKGFKYRTSFLRHIRIHSKEEPFKCDHCLRTFKEKDYLVAHRKTHSDAKTVDRTKYTWRYKNEGKFRQSKTNCRENKRNRGSDRAKKEFKCKICLKMIKNENELNSHFDGHTGKYLFECSLCKHGFDYRPNLYRHMKKHEGRKPYKCVLCPQRYGDTHGLKVHIRCHNGEKVECEICLKKFSDKGYLKLHKRIHTGEMPFDCHQCKRKFRVKQSLKLHKCYKCHICSLIFHTKPLITRHMLSHKERTLKK